MAHISYNLTHASTANASRRNNSAIDARPGMSGISNQPVGQFIYLSHFLSFYITNTLLIARDCDKVSIHQKQSIHTRTRAPGYYHSARLAWIPALLPLSLDSNTLVAKSDLALVTFLLHIVCRLQFTGRKTRDFCVLSSLWGRRLNYELVGRYVSSTSYPSTLNRTVHSVRPANAYTFTIAFERTGRTRFDYGRQRPEHLDGHAEIVHGGCTLYAGLV